MNQLDELDRQILDTVVRGRGRGIPIRDLIAEFPDKDVSKLKIRRRVYRLQRLGYISIRHLPVTYMAAKKKTDDKQEGDLNVLSS
jgi:DNA-binding Lrp family transcriptional regulator